MHSKKLKSVLEGNSGRRIRRGKSTQLVSPPPVPTPSVSTPPVPTSSVPTKTVVTPPVPTQPPPPRNFFDVLNYLFKGQMTPNKAGALGKEWGTNLRKYGRIHPPNQKPSSEIKPARFEPSSSEEKANRESRFDAAKEKMKQMQAAEDEREKMLNRFRSYVGSMEENKIKAYSGIFLLEVKDLASDYFNRAGRTKWSLRFLMKKPDELPIKTFPKDTTKKLPPPKKPKELGYKG